MAAVLVWHVPRHVPLGLHSLQVPLQRHNSSLPGWVPMGQGGFHKPRFEAGVCAAISTRLEVNQLSHAGDDGLGQGTWRSTFAGIVGDGSLHGGCIHFCRGFHRLGLILAEPQSSPVSLFITGQRALGWVASNNLVMLWWVPLKCVQIGGLWRQRDGGSKYWHGYHCLLVLWEGRGVLPGLGVWLVLKAPCFLLFWGTTLGKEAAGARSSSRAWAVWAIGLSTCSTEAAGAGPSF